MSRYVVTAYPMSGGYTSARAKAMFRGIPRATMAEAERDQIAYDALNLADPNENHLTWWIEVVDGTEGTEDPLSRTLDGRARQLTS